MSNIQPSSGSLHAIIHAAAVAAGGVGAGLAQLPGSDAPVLIGLQAAMVTAIAYKYGVELSHAAAVKLVMTFAATMAGRGISQWLIGWWPGVGNTINAATAASITEAVGWLTASHFAA